jgi:3-hydroxybutyryl-CoA dehydratase
VNHVLTATRSFTEADIDVCGRLTNDLGSHHMKGHDGRRMAQGALTLTAVPLFAVPGVHMREVSLTFLAPVYAGETVTASVEVTGREELDDGRVALACRVEVVNGEGKPVIAGGGVALLAASLADSCLAQHGASSDGAP